MTDGTCPACGRNTNDRAMIDPDKVLIGIQSGAELPAVCHACGLPATRFLKVSATNQSTDPVLTPGIGGALASFLFGGVFYGLPALLFGAARRSKAVTLALRVPTCVGCSHRMGKILPRYVDFEERRFDLVVHKEFKRALADRL